MHLMHTIMWGRYVQTIGCACRLLVDCNQLAVDIDNELVVVHNWVRLNPLFSRGAARVVA